MNRKHSFFIALFLSSALAFAQKKLPILKANSIQVNIREDGALRVNAWRVVPAEKLDVYTTSAKKITFITDADSITFKINPKTEHYDFVILLNGKDSAHTQIHYQPSRLDVLKKAGTYNTSDNRPVPAFSYMTPQDAHLVKIRQDLNLDSIAGEDDELLQIFNLMHWVHNLVKHDGNSENPTLKNAIDLIKVCKAENRGVNCRMMATILNECYLAMGIPSRYITCMPKETHFDDCHVINMVYSRELKKWLWMDPTFDAYVMDEKGNLLSVEEVRERLVKGAPLVLNADANWNHEVLKTKKEYLDYYMAKNLYRIQAPLRSEYDSETWTKGKEINYIELLPLDGLEQTPQKQEADYKEQGVKYIFYKTNNPALFWAKPE